MLKVVYRDQPGELEKTGLISVWIKKDRGVGENIQ